MINEITLPYQKKLAAVLLDNFQYKITPDIFHFLQVKQKGGAWGGASCITKLIYQAHYSKKFKIDGEGEGESNFLSEVQQRIQRK